MVFVIIPGNFCLPHSLLSVFLFRVASPCLCVSAFCMTWSFFHFTSRFTSKPNSLWGTPFLSRLHTYALCCLCSFSLCVLSESLSGQFLLFLLSILLTLCNRHLPFSCMSAIYFPAKYIPHLHKASVYVIKVKLKVRVENLFVCRVVLQWHTPLSWT